MNFSDFELLQKNGWKFKNENEILEYEIKSINYINALIDKGFATEEVLKKAKEQKINIDLLKLIKQKKEFEKQKINYNKITKGDENQPKEYDEYLIKPRIGKKGEEVKLFLFKIFQKKVYVENKTKKYNSRI